MTKGKNKAFKRRAGSGGYENGAQGRIAEGARNRT